jgi:hypothetical protein
VRGSQKRGWVAGLFFFGRHTFIDFDLAIKACERGWHEIFDRTPFREGDRVEYAQIQIFRFRVYKNNVLVCKLLKT